MVLCSRTTPFKQNVLFKLYFAVYSYSRTFKRYNIWIY
nr:MAG TPA: hypothetical protein [Caudoviricetes sp.]